MKIEDEERYVVERRKHCFAILNKYPYNNGHILITPNRHIGEFELLNDEEHIEISFLVRDSIELLKKLYMPHGFNIGVNLGRVAGAGLPEHIHYHVIPRWNGDTSFISTASDLKVVSIGIEETYSGLAELFRSLKSKN